LFLRLNVEVFEHDFGPGEVAADVVPDERLDLVGADAGVVGGEATLVRAAVAHAGVAADLPAVTADLTSQGVIDIFESSRDLTNGETQPA
jgi:hypothetical protein